MRTWRLVTIDDLAPFREDLAAALPELSDVTGLDGTPGAVLLVASELATNALRYGGGPATVRLFERPDETLLDVVDRAPDRAPQVPDARHAGGGGFGLILAGRLADELGWCRADGTKHVWARFAIPARAHAVPA